ncbi:helix-turn-helix domain-containing protein [Carnobacterium sp. ISL-102]|uniref:helix-turn-helix domain-containing protein n=1 Tax=Carnobacterium sp. ISL-102 TaxID=2819142 RepID=UPI001BE65A55|nr:helix-turn-helix domain-containing protein [Carnobacterium sp. ISL-102]MBT2731128.1 helix-turn-helix domain-containing protein [Carnobacterium sp. ISL-102]
MRLLMDSSSLRRLELLELLNGSDEWWIVEEIALWLNCSVRTVKADIFYYNTFSSNSIKLITSNHHGVKLILPAYFQMESIYQEILADNVNYQLLECLYQEKLESIEDYAEKLFTSTSSIIRSIKQINLFLEEYNLTIQKKPMRIIGSEKQIRYFYSIFFWEKYGTKMAGNQHVEFTEARCMIQELEKKTDLTLSHIVENKIAICLLICLERISKGYILQEYTAPIKVSQTVLAIIEDLLKDIPLTIQKSEVEFMGFYFTDQHLNPEPQLNQLSKELLAIFQYIGQFLTDFSEKYSFVLPNKDVVQRNIFHHIVYNREFQGSNFFLINHTKNTLVNIDSMYHPFIELVFEEVESRSNSRWIMESKQEFIELLYLLIVYWEGLTAQILYLQEKTNVLIISQFGKAHEFFLADILESYFPNELHCFSETDKKFKDSEIEIVVTDTQVEEIRKNPLNEVPVIGIEYAPNERNWKMIRNVLTEIKKSKEEGSN